MVPFLLAAVASDGSVTFDSNAPAATDFWIGPQRYGAAKVFGTEDAVEGTDTRANGLRYTSEGVLRVYDATSAVPAGATTLGGFAVTSDGQLCVSTDSVASATFVGGIAVRSDGAVFATGLSTPRSIADAIISALTPAAWYRNATGVTSAGGFASQWDDYSGNTRHLVQATGTNQPAYSAGILTGDGVDNFMKAASFALSGPFSFYMVLMQNSFLAGDYFCDGNTSDTAGVVQAGTTPTIAITAGGFGAQAQNTDLSIGAWGVVRSVFNGAVDSSLKVDANTATTGATVAGVNAAGFTLFARADSGLCSAASVAEIVIIPSVLSAEDDANLTACLAAIRDSL